MSVYAYVVSDTMQRFQVPQFIAVEDKIIGNILTAKQFVYIASGVVLIVLIFFAFAGFLALLLSFLVAATAVSLAWGKINGIPVPTVILHALLFLVKPRVYVWKRSRPTGRKTGVINIPPETPVALPLSPKLSHSRLSELSWTLDTKTHDELTRPPS